MLEEIVEARASREGKMASMWNWRTLEEWVWRKVKRDWRASVAVVKCSFGMLRMSVLIVWDKARLRSSGGPAGVVRMTERIM